MDIKAYIESGILELYALELLPAAEAEEVDRLLAIHAELGEELEHIYKALEGYAQLNSVEPSEHIRLKLIDKIVNSEKEKLMDPLDLPLITNDSNYLSWQNFVSKFPSEPLGDEGKSVKVLTATANVTQLFVASATDIAEEIHSDELESFLILSGECLCTINEKTRMMGPGDFMEIPLHEPHDVKLLSDKVMAILQLVKI